MKKAFGVNGYQYIACVLIGVVLAFICREIAIRHFVVTDRLALALLSVAFWAYFRDVALGVARSQNGVKSAWVPK